MASILLGSEPKWVKDVKAMIYDDSKTEPLPVHLRGLVQYSHDRRMCSDMFDALEKALQPTPNWKTLVKAIIVVRYLVVYGAEHVVDRCWRLQKLIKELGSYNSATVGKYAFQRGGQDQGADVRRRGMELSELLADVERIRRLRADAAKNVDVNAVASVGAVGGLGGSTGVVIGAGHSLAEIPGFGSADLAMAAMAAEAEEDQAEEEEEPEAKSADLLDFSLDDAAATSHPTPEMLLSAEQRDVQRQLELQQSELAELKKQLALQQQMQHQPRPASDHDHTPYGFPGGMGINHMQQQQQEQPGFYPPQQQQQHQPQFHQQAYQLQQGYPPMQQQPQQGYPPSMMQQQPPLQQGAPPSMPQQQQQQQQQQPQWAPNPF